MCSVPVEEVHVSQSSDPAWLTEVTSGQVGSSQFFAHTDFAIQHTFRKTDVLFVTFDNLSSAREQQHMRDPWGFTLARKSGWSHLGVLSYRPNWFRTPSLFAQLEKLAAKGLFKGFKRVVFSGTSMGGFGACAFSPLAPGCEVIAFSPQSTLSPDLAGWDTRYPMGTSANWDGPYADAAQSAASAARVWLVYDPRIPEDLRHAQRFTSPNVAHLKARNAGHKTAWFLRTAGVLGNLTREIIDETMSEPHFYQLYRETRRLRSYEMSVVERAMARGGPDSKAQLAQILRARKRPAIAQKIEARLQNAG